MTKRHQTSLLLAAVALVAPGCDTIAPITAPPLTSGRADFAVVAAVGTGFTAGFQSGGLVGRHQTHSYASVFAQQVGARPLDLPLIGGDGQPPLLEVKHLFPPPVQIGPISGVPGTPINSGLASSYHNLGVPGALLQDLTDTTRYATAPYFADIQRGRGSIARQLAEQLSPQPTFLLFEYGSTELLTSALAGNDDNLLPLASFADRLNRGLDTLAVLLPSAKLAVLNVPDVTELPFFTTVSNKQLDAAGRPVLDASGRPTFLLGVVNENDRVLLSAQPQVANGNGYPIGSFSYLSGSPVEGTGNPLTDAQVLSSSEVNAIQDRARRYNSVIDTTARSVAKPRDFATADFHGLIHRAGTTGIEIGRTLYTSAFVTGGLYSLDGIHPNDLAHALLCNEVIRAVNARFGSTIPPVDPLRFATFTSSRATPSREEAAPR